MSQALKAIVDGYSDLLIQALEIKVSDQLLYEILLSIDKTHSEIDSGLLK